MTETIAEFEATEQQIRSAVSTELQSSEGHDFSECEEHNQRLIVLRLTQSMRTLQVQFDDVVRRVALGSRTTMQEKSEQVTQEHFQYLEMIKRMSAKEFTKEGCLAF